MKHHINRLGLALAPVDQNRVRLALVILTLILFVLGGGAPGVMGGSDG